VGLHALHSWLRRFIEYFAVPLLKRHVKGVLEIFHRSAINLTGVAGFLEAGVQSAIAIDNAQMFNELERSNTELALAYDTTLEVVVPSITA